MKRALILIFGILILTVICGVYADVSYNPPTQANPIISSINIPSMQQGSTGSASLIITNSASTSGTVSVTATSINSAISPSAQSVDISDQKTLYFSVTAGTTIGTNSGQICFKVCTSSQFGDNKCDNSCKSFDIINNIPEYYCGDGICESNENDAKCPNDCHKTESNSGVVPYTKCIEGTATCELGHTQLWICKPDGSYKQIKCNQGCDGITNPPHCIGNDEVNPSSNSGNYVPYLIIAIAIILGFIILAFILKGKKR